MAPNFGLPQRSIDKLHTIFAKYSKVKKVVLYGSRAMANYKNGSDIDLTLYGSALTVDDLSNIAGELEESSIPYLVDLSIFDTLDHVKLKDHINRKGQVFYDRYAEWKTVKLGDVCDFQNGFAFKSTLFRKTGKPILRISNIQNQEIDIRKTVYFDTDDYDTEFTRYEVKPNDLLIAMSGATTGKIGFNKTNITFYLNQPVGNLKPKSILDKMFLYYRLFTKVEENLGISKGAAQPSLSSEQVKDISFSLPPLAEQQRIVAKLDAAFAEIDKASKVTKRKRDAILCLFENAINNEFRQSFEKQAKPFLDVCVLQRGFDLPKSQRHSGQYPLYSANGITDFIDTSKLEAPGVITGYSGTIGQVYYTNKPYWALNTALYVKDFKENDSKYIFYFLKSFNLKKFASDAEVPRLNRNVLSEEIAYIEKNIDAQRNISEKLDAIKKSVGETTRILDVQLQNYQSLKSAILAQELQSEAA